MHWAFNFCVCKYLKRLYNILPKLLLELINWLSGGSVRKVCQMQNEDRKKNPTAQRSANTEAQGLTPVLHIHATRYNELGNTYFVLSALDSKSDWLHHGQEKEEIRLWEKCASHAPHPQHILKNI